MQLCAEMYLAAIFRHK